MLETLKDILAFGGEKKKRSVWKNFWERITWVKHLNYFFVHSHFKQSLPTTRNSCSRAVGALKDAPTTVLAVLEGTQDRI